MYGKERQTMSRIEDAVKKINLDIQKEPDNGIPEWDFLYLF